MSSVLICLALLVPSPANPIDRVVTAAHVFAMASNEQKGIGAIVSYPSYYLLPRIDDTVSSSGSAAPLHRKRRPLATAHKSFPGTRYQIMFRGTPSAYKAQIKSFRKCYDALISENWAAMFRASDPEVVFIESMQLYPKFVTTSSPLEYKVKVWSLAAGVKNRDKPLLQALKHFAEELRISEGPNNWIYFGLEQVGREMPFPGEGPVSKIASNTIWKFMFSRSGRLLAIVNGQH